MCKPCVVDYYRWKDIKTKYGLTKEAYLLKLESQGGVCAICKRPNRHDAWLAVDHDHSTNVVRDLLCNTCNQALGMANDDRDLLLAMVAYLDKHSKD